MAPFGFQGITGKTGEKPVMNTGKRTSGTKARENMQSESPPQHLDLKKRAWALTEEWPESDDAALRLSPPKSVIQGDDEDGNLHVIKKIYCNKCGKSCESGDTAPGYRGLLNYKHFGGYASEYHSGLEDLTTYTFSICDPCIKELMDGFVRPAVKGEYGFH